MDGILIVDKPAGKTSFDMVRDVRNKYKIKKVGHIGTLDPMATGVLPILIGNATKLSNILMEHDKEYIAILKLGKSTDTGDSEGKTITLDKKFYIEEKNDVNLIENNIDSIVENNKTNNINSTNENKILESNVNNTNENFSNESKIKIKDFEKDVKSVLLSFLGNSMQMPPMYSAIKVNGKKLYEIAREGKTIDRNPRNINISEIELLECNEYNEIKFRVVCSKGTYIRVLCEDIAKKIGTCGYMKYLRRTRVGNFRIEDANRFIKMEDIFAIPKIYVLEDELKKISNGITIYKKEINNYSGLCNIYFNNKYIGICDVEKGKCKRKIFVD